MTTPLGAEIDRLRAENAELFMLLADEKKALQDAEALAQRSTRRLVELSEPGFIGAFAARDMAVDRANAAEAALAIERGAHAFAVDQIRGIMQSRIDAAEQRLKQIEAETIERCAHEASCYGASGTITMAIRALAAAQKGET